MNLPGYPLPLCRPLAAPQVLTRGRFASPSVRGFSEASGGRGGPAYRKTLRRRERGEPSPALIIKLQALVFLGTWGAGGVADRIMVLECFHEEMGAKSCRKMTVAVRVA